MLLPKILYFGAVFVFTWLLLFLQVPFLWIFAIVLPTALIAALSWLLSVDARIRSYLDEACDPEKFLTHTEKRGFMGKSIKAKNFYYINMAVGHICLGQFDKAGEFLSLTDMTVETNKMKQNAYYLAQLSCCIDKADSSQPFSQERLLLKDNLAALRPYLQHPRIFFSIDLTFLSENYEQNKSSEAAKIYGEQLDYLYQANKKYLSKRQKLAFLYEKANIEYDRGNQEAAAKKYAFVAENGNKLFLAQKAKEKYQQLTSNYGAQQ